MSKISMSVIKRLYTQSGNECAFTGCNQKIVDSDIVLGEICHIRAQSPGGPRYDPDMTDKALHSFENLIILCQKHHTIIDAKPDIYTIEALTAMKTEHEHRGFNVNPTVAEINLFCELVSHLDIENAKQVRIGSAVNVTVKTAKTPSIKQKLPDNCIGSDSVIRGYVKHLIDRYNDFAKLQPGRDFHHWFIYTAIEREFGQKWDWIDKQNFDALVAFLHKRINNTMQGRINKSKGIKNYSSFEEYTTKFAL
jgi:hypothetical protein